MSRQQCILLSLLALAALAPVLKPVEAAETLSWKNLAWHYYKLNTTCKYAETYIRSQVEFYMKEQNDSTIAPKLLRLLYSDCFVTVCVCFLLLFFDFFRVQVLLYFDIFGVF